MVTLCSPAKASTRSASCCEADLLVGLDERAPALGLDLLGREAPDEHLVGLTAGLEQRRLEVLLGAAVLLADDHVLRDVDQAAREVAGVGGAQRGVGQALAGAVRRGEVLDDVEPLHEVRLHGALDDLALRVGHQAAHAGQLADLLERAAGARAGHHVDGVQLVVGLDVLDHRLRDLLGRGVPLVRDRQVALLLGDQALLVLILDGLHLRLVAPEDLLLGGRHDDVVLGDRDAGLRREAEAEVLERVEDLGDRRGAERLHQLIDELRRVALLQRLVDELVLRAVELLAQRLLQRPLDAVVEDDPPDGGGHVAALHPVGAVVRDVVQADDVVLVGQLRLLGGPEHVDLRLVLLRVDRPPAAPRPRRR